MKTKKFIIFVSCFIGLLSSTGLWAASSLTIDLNNFISGMGLPPFVANPSYMPLSTNPVATLQFQDVGPGQVEMTVTGNTPAGSSEGVSQIFFNVASGIGALTFNNIPPHGNNPGMVPYTTFSGTPLGFLFDYYKVKISIPNAPSSFTFSELISATGLTASSFDAVSTHGFSNYYGYLATAEVSPLGGNYMLPNYYYSGSLAPAVSTPEAPAYLLLGSFLALALVGRSAWKRVPTEAASLR